MDDILIFYVTHPNKEHAQRIARVLIEESLIACSNMFDMNSLYTWDGQLCNDNECTTLYKTAPELEDTVANRIEDLHEYDVPCIMRYKAGCNQAYKNWVYELTVLKLRDDETK